MMSLRFQVGFDHFFHGQEINLLFPSLTMGGRQPFSCCVVFALARGPRLDCSSDPVFTLMLIQGFSVGQVTLKLSAWIPSFGVYICIYYIIYMYILYNIYVYIIYII